MKYEPQKPLIVLVAGPTASGKTNLSIKLAQHYKTEILSADSRQFFKEMKIGTAAPDSTEISQAKHHFIGNKSIHDGYSAAAFEQDALKVLEDIFNTNQIAIVTGGSGLYLNVLCNGIDDLPDPTPELRQKLKDEYAQYGIGYIQQKLKTLDTTHYERIDRQNPKRILRALEVCITSGKPYSSFLGRKKTDRPFNTCWIGIEWEREKLNERINLRVDQMMKEGLLEEVRSLMAHKSINALNTLGYKELFDYFDKKYTLDEAIEKIKVNTRKYAKRQMTWFRRNPEIQWVNPLNFKEIIRIIDHCN